MHAFSEPRKNKITFSDKSKPTLDLEVGGIVRYYSSPTSPGELYIIAAEGRCQRLWSLVSLETGGMLILVDVPPGEHDEQPEYLLPRGAFVEIISQAPRKFEYLGRLTMNIIKE